MKIDRQGQYLIIEVGEKAPERSDFFYALSGIPFKEWLDEATVVYDTTLFAPETTAKHLRRIENASNNRGIEITEGAKEMIADYGRRLAETEDARRTFERREMEKRKAVAKLIQGCFLCEELTHNGQGRWFCKHTGELCSINPKEVELNFELWKETKVWRQETPFPCEGCKYVEYARKIWHEENKE